MLIHLFTQALEVEDRRIDVIETQNVRFENVDFEFVSRIKTLYHVLIDKDNTVRYIHSHPICFMQMGCLLIAPLV